MSSLEKTIHDAKQANREHAKEASRAVTKKLDERNAQAKEKREQRYNNTIGEISKYHLDRALKNKTYH